MFGYCSQIALMVMLGGCASGQRASVERTQIPSPAGGDGSDAVASVSQTAVLRVDGMT